MDLEQTSVATVTSGLFQIYPFSCGALKLQVRRPDVSHIAPRVRMGSLCIIARAHPRPLFGLGLVPSHLHVVDEGVCHTAPQAPTAVAQDQSAYPHGGVCSRVADRGRSCFLQDSSAHAAPQHCL